MKNWFDLAARQHSLVKEALPLLSAGRAIAGLLGKGAKTVAKSPMKSLGTGMVGLDAASAAAQASGDVARSRRGAQMAAGMSQGRTF